MHVGILGGTGPAGSGLGARLASVGIEVTIGSRSNERAADTVASIRARWPDRPLTLQAGDNRAAADADLIVIATPWDAAAATARSLADRLAGKVTISMANALARVGGELEPLVPPRGSVAAHVQSSVPAALVAAALHHIPARALGDLDHPLESDVLICSDSQEATKITHELVDLVPGLRPLDAGSLSNASAIEAFTAVLLHLNGRYRAHTALRITGLEW
jgi:NADPH-dependent F420 reductase